MPQARPQRDPGHQQQQRGIGRCRKRGGHPGGQGQPRATGPPPLRQQRGAQVSVRLPRHEVDRGRQRDPAVDREAPGQDEPPGGPQLQPRLDPRLARGVDGQQRPRVNRQRPARPDDGRPVEPDRGRTKRRARRRQTGVVDVPLVQKIDRQRQPGPSRHRATDPKRRAAHEPAEEVGRAAGVDQLAAKAQGRLARRADLGDVAEVGGVERRRPAGQRGGRGVTGRRTPLRPAPEQRSRPAAPPRSTPVHAARSRQARGCPSPTVDVDQKRVRERGWPHAGRHRLQVEAPVAQAGGPSGDVGVGQVRQPVAVAVGRRVLREAGLDDDPGVSARRQQRRQREELVVHVLKRLGAERIPHGSAGVPAPCGPGFRSRRCGPRRPESREPPSR